MTLVMIWPNKMDNPTGLHIASDSLLSDNLGKWPYATKIFRLYPTHEHLAYSGTSAMALAAIMQGTAVLAQTNILSRDTSERDATMTGRSSALRTLLNDAIKVYPNKWIISPTTLLYCGYDRHRRKFRLFRLSLDSAGVQVKEENLKKDRVSCFGSGESKARSLLEQAHTTEEILGVLKSVMEEKSIDTVGGVPQMVTIRRRGSHAVGFNWKIDELTQSTLFGLPLHFRSSMEKVKFLDDKFKPAKYLNNPRVRRVAP